MKVVTAYLIDKSMTMPLAAVSLNSCHLPAGNAPFIWQYMENSTLQLETPEDARWWCIAQSQLTKPPRNFQAAVLGLSTCGEMVEIHTAQPAICRGKSLRGSPRGSSKETPGF
jgi:hypothetical protein